MLYRNVREKGLTEMLEKTVVEKCRRRVLYREMFEKSVVESAGKCVCWRNISYE